MKDLLAAFMALLSILVSYFIVLFVGFYFGPLGAIVAAIFLFRITVKAFKNL